MNLRTWTCLFLGHKYEVLRALNPHTRKVGCARCGKAWAMHDPTRAFVPWDTEIEEMYAPGGIFSADWKRE